MFGNNKSEFKNAHFQVGSLLGKRLFASKYGRQLAQSCYNLLEGKENILPIRLTKAEREKLNLSIPKN
jgi:hypothetical protein